MSHYAILDGTKITGTMEVDGPYSGGVLLSGPVQWASKPSQHHVAHLVNGQVVWQDSRVLSEAKASKVTELKQAREAAVNSTFTWDGSEFDCDQVSQTRLMGLYVDSLRPGFVSRSWRLTNNAWRSLNAAAAAAVWEALANHLNTQFTKFATLESQVNSEATDTLAKVDAIVW